MFARRLLALLFVLFGVASLHAQQCGALTKLSSPASTITTAERVPAGIFVSPATAKKLADLPSFCRVTVLLKPTAESNIHAEIWMPAS
ncbi:MAG TPA: tannase/feruloyl esterase family alpha/beta hydrolase, partial [Edaphobacter sp.]|nr:tannase/feruloyl esterase family alpha/beta hydrolase [Edaphobacter sp.]